MTGVTAVSLCAGVGGIDLALQRAGVHVVAAVEIGPACRGVLARHFPHTVLFSDIREVTGDQLRAAGFVPERGILAAGWPCTGNSIAGRRQGMADPRSGLWLHVARLLAELSPAWFLGENVPGLYSVNNGADIAVVRGDLAQRGYWWAERILDAQHFGVPQRRRRVFFAGCLGNRAAPVQVLFDGAGGEWDSAPGRTAGAGAAGQPADGAGDAGTVGTLGTTGPGGGWRIGADEAAAGQLIAATIQGGGRRGHRVDAEGAAGGHLVAAEVAYALTARNDRNDREQTWVTSGGLNPGGRRKEDDTNLVAIPLQEIKGRTSHHPRAGSGIAADGDPMYTLQAEHQHGIAMAFNWQTGGDGRLGYGDKPTALQASQTTAVALSENQRGEVREPAYSHQVTAGGGKPGQGYPAVRAGTAVRRLTPRECERLQGLPNDWTRWLADGTEQSDSARYRQVGNSVAVPVVEWITRRIVAVTG